MSVHLDAAQCRDRAELLRALANETMDAQHRESLLRVAEYYEDMAAAFEKECEKPAGSS